MKKLKNHERIRRRRNFLPTLGATLLGWTGWLLIVFRISPSNNLVIFAFYLSFSISIFLTASLLLANSRRGFLVAMAAVGYLTFRYYQLADPLNLGIFAGLLICLEIYFQKNSRV